MKMLLDVRNLGFQGFEFRGLRVNAGIRGSEPRAEVSVFSLERRHLFLQLLRRLLFHAVVTEAIGDAEVQHVVIRREGTADVEHQVFSGPHEETDRQSLGSVVEAKTERTGNLIVFVVILRMKSGKSRGRCARPVDAIFQVLLPDVVFVHQVIDVRPVSGNIRRVLLDVHIRFVELSPIDRVARGCLDGARSHVRDLISAVIEARRSKRNRA